MPTRHTYASTDDLRDYLAGTSYSSGWTSDANILRRILEASTSRIDNYVGMQSFGARSETHHYDIGTGTLRESPQPSVSGVSSGELGIGDKLVAVIPFEDWLIDTTTVTNYSGTDRTTSETLTEGYANDYWLEPYNSNPKVRLKFNEDSTKSFNAGQQTLAIAGIWGFTNDTTVETDLAVAITDADATSVEVTNASSLSIAQTILVGTEQMYITGISSNTLTVERGCNGTTSATHLINANVSSYDYPPLVVQACLDLAKIEFRDRDMGVTNIIGTGEQGITRADVSATTILRSLDEYQATTPVSEVYF